MNNPDRDARELRSPIAGLAVAAIITIISVPTSFAQSSAPSGDGQRTPPLISGAMTGIGDGMSEGEIRDLLEAKGYTGLQGLSRQNGRYEIRSAERYGKPVQNLSVDAGTGQVDRQQPLDQDQVKSLLRRRGYMNIREVSQEGHVVRAQADRDDRAHSIAVDPHSARVITDCP